MLLLSAPKLMFVVKYTLLYILFTYNVFQSMSFNKEIFLLKNTEYCKSCLWKFKEYVNRNVKSQNGSVLREELDVVI